MKIFKLLTIVLIIKNFSSKISIIHPPELASKFLEINISAVYSSFGKIPFNFYTQGEIYYDNITNNIQGCSPLNYTLKIKEFDDFPILLLKRGGCSYVTKVRNAQIAKAKMVFIINNEPGNINHLVMGDDGTGIDITIPSVLITQEVGEILIEYYLKKKKKEKIIVDISFDGISSDKVVVELFFSSYEKRAYTFIENMRKYFDEFENNVIFVPQYVIFKSPFYRSDKPSKTENCVSKGLYCSLPKPSSVIKDGRAIVLENLRQKCLHKKYESNMDFYYSYMSIFYSKCLNLNNPKFNAKCSKLVLSDMGLNETDLDGCFAESFGISDVNDDKGYENDNYLLKELYKTKENYLINTLPALYINKIPLLGSITEMNLVDALCNAVRTKPDICQVPLPTKAMKLSKGIIIIIGITILVNIFVIVICWKYISKKINERNIEIGGMDIDTRINMVVNNYFAFKDPPESKYKEVELQ